MPAGKTPLEAKIEQLLTEARVLIPGAQAAPGLSDGCHADNRGPADLKGEHWRWGHSEQRVPTDLSTGLEHPR